MSITERLYSQVSILLKENMFEISNNSGKEIIINIKERSLKVFVNEEGNVVIDCDGFYIASDNVPGGCIVELTVL